MPGRRLGRVILLSLCIFIVLAVLFSAISVPSSTRLKIPSSISTFADKFKDDEPPPSSDPVVGDAPTTNPLISAPGVGGEEKKEDATKEEKPTPAAPAAEPTKTSEFDERLWNFQVDLPLAMPTWDAHTLRRYMPKNYLGKGRPTFATYLSTRNGSLHDPYYMAALQLTYRMLWDKRSASNKYPLTVFVAPFIPDEHRDLLEAAGAIVREIDLIEWHPTKDTNTFARWKDLFSKLNMWSQTDFSLIAFLDVDAFPMQNIDDIFDIAEEQKCVREFLVGDDKKREKEICDYTYTGTEVQGSEEINVGVMVFNPNLAMHARLTREAKHTEKFDNKMAEQAFLGYAYDLDGPFPAHFIDRKWNGYFPQKNEQKKLKIVHEKLWVPMENLPWGAREFTNTWHRMCKFYESKKFRDNRAREGYRLY